MKTIVTKFVVTKNREVPFHADPQKKVAQVTMHPLVQTEEGSENRTVWDGSPEGVIELNSMNTEQFKGLPIGSVITATFTPELPQDAV